MIVRARHSVCSLLISSLSTQATRVARALQASHPECGAAGVSVRTARPRIMCVRCSEFHRLSLLHFCRPGTRRGFVQGCTAHDDDQPRRRDRRRDLQKPSQQRTWEEKNRRPHDVALMHSNALVSRPAHASRSVKSATRRAHSALDRDSAPKQHPPTQHHARNIVTSVFVMARTRVP